MAGRRGDGSGSGSGGPAEDPAATAQVERALTALEELVLSGRAADIPRWTAVLWHHRAETERVLLRRLASGTVRVPALFLEVLAGLGGARAQTLLRQVATSPEVPDLLRLEARRRAGWTDRSGPRARANYLRTLRDVGGALRAYAAMASGTPAPDGEIAGEILGYLLAMSGEQRLALTARIAGEQGPGVSWLLRALLAAPDAVTRELAVSELLELRDRGAVPALQRLSCSPAPTSVRAAAEVAFRRLSLRSLGGSQPAAGRARGNRRRGTQAVPEAPAFERALVSPVDGMGTQSVSIIRSWDADARFVAQFSLGDEGGIESAGGVMRVPREQAHKVLRRIGERGCPLAAVSLEEARGAVLWAVERALAEGRLPPPAFALWEPYLYDDLCPKATSAPSSGLVLAGGADAPAGEATPDLLSTPFFASWHFSLDRLALALRDLPEPVDGPAARYTAVLAAVCPPEAQALWVQRLRRQAWVLERCGRQDLRDAALGCAARLEHAVPGDLADLPLLRGMLARGLAALRNPVGPRGRGGRRAP